MSTYQLERRLSHAEVDFLGELKVGALLGLLEQAAVEASTAAGYGAERYTREGRVWIIRRTRLKRLQPVGGTDGLTIETSVQDFRRARSLRRYDVRRKDDPVARATTDWVYCDLASGRPVRIDADLQRALSAASPTPLPRAEALPGEPISEPDRFEIVVRPSHLDHVRHVNNGIYANFLEDAAFASFAARGFPLPRMLEQGGALRIAELDIEYLNAAVIGDSLEVRTWVVDGNVAASPASTCTVLQSICRDSTEIVRAVTQWVWRRSSPILGGIPS